METGSENQSRNVEQPSQYRWTGTQYGEGQSGTGPSSLAQGAQWGGQPSHGVATSQQGVAGQRFGGQGYGQGGGGQTYSGQTYLGQGYSGQGYEQYGGSLPPWAFGTGRESGIGIQGGVQGGIQGGTPVSFGGQGGLGGQRWTGTQYGEGQSGMGPSSLAQGVQWGGQPTYPGMGMPQGLTGQRYGGQGYEQFSGNLPPWAFGTGRELGQGVQGGVQGPIQGGIPGGFGGQRWTGTQYGEGQSGMGPSSLYQGARFIGQSSLQGGYMGQGIGSQWTGTQYGEGRPGAGPSSLAQGARWGGEPSWNPQGVQR